jgi:hypothetical protein
MGAQSQEGNANGHILLCGSPCCSEGSYLCLSSTFPLIHTNFLILLARYDSLALHKNHWRGLARVNFPFLVHYNVDSFDRLSQLLPVSF